MLRFNKDAVIGQTHHELRDQGTYWEVLSFLFNHDGSVQAEHETVYARDMLPHLIVAAQVRALEVQP